MLVTEYIVLVSFRQRVSTLVLLEYYSQATCILEIVIYF
jgi:hypothetical protein